MSNNVERDDKGRVKEGSVLNPNGGADERRRVMSDKAFLQANARNLKKAADKLGTLLNTDDPTVILKAIAQIHDIHAKGEDRKFKNKKFLAELRAQKEANETKNKDLETPTQPSVVVSMTAVD